MTAFQLRSATLHAITASCPVEVRIETPTGPLRLAIAGFDHERIIDPDDPKRLVSERLVLVAQPTCIPRRFFVGLNLVPG